MPLAHDWVVEGGGLLVVAEEDLVGAVAAGSILLPELLPLVDAEGVGHDVAQRPLLGADEHEARHLSLRAACVVIHEQTLVPLPARLDAALVRDEKCNPMEGAGAHPLAGAQRLGDATEGSLLRPVHISTKAESSGQQGQATCSGMDQGWFGMEQCALAHWPHVCSDVHSHRREASGCALAKKQTLRKTGPRSHGNDTRCAQSATANLMRAGLMCTRLAPRPGVLPCLVDAAGASAPQVTSQSGIRGAHRKSLSMARGLSAKKAGEPFFDQIEEWHSSSDYLETLQN